MTESRVLTPEQVKVHRDFWEGSDTAVTPDEHMVALCDSHESLRAERDESRARCERLEAALRKAQPFIAGWTGFGDLDVQRDFTECAAAIAAALEVRSTAGPAEETP